MVKIDFPALKRWKWNAYMNSNMWWIPDGMRSTVLLEGLDIDVLAGLQHTEKGYLRPKVYSMKIEVGNSAFWHDDEWLKLFLEQFTNFALVMVENSAYFIGDILFTKMGEPVLTSFLNDYKLPLRGMPSPFQGQTATADFELDYRQTADPFITTG